MESQMEVSLSSSGTLDAGNLDELTQLQNLNVWGKSQEVLEEEALKELEIFSNENQNSNLEDGEIIDTDESKQSTIGNSALYSRYIKSQEEFKKRQDHKRSLEVSDRSKEIANQISINHNKSLTAKIKKRKKYTIRSSINSKRVKTCKKNKDNLDNESGSDYAPSDGYSSYDSEQELHGESIPKGGRNRISMEKIIDDGCPKLYKLRLGQYYKDVENECQEESEYTKPDVEIPGGLKVPYRMWINLYSYQQEGIKWLWGVHQQATGGLLGDEMGLGKTVQIIVFLYALQNSNVICKYGRGLGPTLIVVPATVIHQWVKHFHDWAPELRAAVLHQSGSYLGSKTKLIHQIHKTKGILITTYSSILKFKDVLTDLNWHYLILDEGHKIRNSTSKISIAVKQIRTPYRIMLTGSPMQNNLQELWSLFDFIVPGMLGTLATFMEHFATPIMVGGYSNCSSIQEATALSTATALKELITPHLLRRSKDEVKSHICLPQKSEQVLFCSLTKEQRDLYKAYLLSEDVATILGRAGKNWFSENYVRSNVLVAITTLRKICNHPDIYSDEWNGVDEGITEEKYGYYKRSGKMVVVSALLKIWKKQKHRVLLFTQSRAMIIIFEAFLQQQGYKYLKMDGSTSISSRQPLINKFNEDTSYDVFLLTTRVGGLGVNLTGANRVIIYDPDWNPATDTQARERAWRIGQDKQVTIYRLISAGTIEEKIYQRQVWKQLLSNKVLLDPRSQKFFKTSDLYDLFSYTEASESNPETANIFRNSRVSLQERINDKNKKGKHDTESYQFSDEKIQAMKNLAQQISKSISDKTEAKVIQKKTSYQLELEEERAQKLQEKQSLKSLTPMELRDLNRKKLGQKEDLTNQIDDCDTNISFSNALEVTEHTSKLYNKLRENKITDIDGTMQYKELISKNVIEKSSSSSSCVDIKNRDKQKKKSVRKVDKSGVVDGEVVEGLLRSEVKKKDKESKNSNHNECQNDYVLEKLFSKKGVHGALEHDMIVQGPKIKESQLKLKWEAQQKTELALQALRKSRFHNWRW